MKDRLISSEILKKRFEEEKRKCDPYNDFFTTNEINLIIDNVVAEHEAYEWCTDCKEYDQEKHCCHRWSNQIMHTVNEIKENADQYRSKGKWEFVQYDANPNIGNWHCSLCRHIIFQKIKATANYCPNCGADMRKENQTT